MTPKELLERKSSYETMLELVDSIFLVRDILDDTEKTAHWFVTKNPHLGNVEPFNFFLISRGHKVLNFIRSAKEGNWP